MLRRRLVTGPLLILGLVGVVALDGFLAEMVGTSGIVFTALAAAIVIPIGGVETAGLLRATGIRAGNLATVLAGEAILLFALGAMLAEDPMIAAGIMLLGPFSAILIAGIDVARGRRIEGGFTAVSGMVTGGLWLGLGLAFWILVVGQVGGLVAAGLVMVVKVGDIGAYATGMSIGRHKLIPWLSPGKTIEGGLGALFWGGLAGGVLALNTSLGTSLAPPLDTGLAGFAVGAAGGVLLAGTGAIGDLLESLLKREAGAKDSGTMLPGMGGMLDVLDSPLLAGPVAWLLVVLAG
ncbi:MAG: phosphatidate cytidylyltransferase [Phycisphaera sp.]|nr:phosphatidate cytidylyltransferase [Phycisphaera sp.]